MPTGLWFTYYNFKSCKPHEKTKRKHQNADFFLKTENFVSLFWLNLTYRWYFETFAVHTKDLYFFWYVNESYIRCAKFIFARFFFFLACVEKQGISYCSIFLLGSPPFPPQGRRSWEGRGGHPQILADQLTLSQPGGRLCPPYY